MAVVQVPPSACTAAEPSSVGMVPAAWGLFWPLLASTYQGEAVAGGGGGPGEALVGFGSVPGEAPGASQRRSGAHPGPGCRSCPGGITRSLGPFGWQPGWAQLPLCLPWPRLGPPCPSPGQLLGSSTSPRAPPHASPGTLSPHVRAPGRCLQHHLALSPCTRPCPQSLIPERGGCACAPGAAGRGCPTVGGSQRWGRGGGTGRMLFGGGTERRQLAKIK